MGMMVIELVFLSIVAYSNAFLRHVLWGKTVLQAKVAGSNSLDCVVLTETTFGNLRCIPAWDRSANRLVRPLLSPHPTCNSDLFWPAKSYCFGECVKFQNVVKPNTTLPHSNEDIFGTVERLSAPIMHADDIFSLLEPHASEIQNGGTDLGLSHGNFCEEGSDIPSMFLVKSTGYSETYLDSTGRLRFSSVHDGLHELPVTSVVQQLEGPTRLPAGSLVLLGLARGWGGRTGVEFHPRRCYIMVIGILPPRAAATASLSEGAEVVKLSRRGGAVKQDCDVYIGRRVARGGWDLPQSKWHNPFHVRDETREARLVAIEQYEEYLLSKPDLMNSLHELRGKRLGCWCKTTPDVPCHGDVLARQLEKRIAAGY